MSWIDKELKRRAAKAQPTEPSPPPAEAASERMQALWGRIVAANAALPAELQLPVESGGRTPASPDGARFVAWLRSPDGAALGFAGDAVRYLWPKIDPRRSNNFWIRWDAQRSRYALHRRITPGMPPTYTQYPFDERRVEYIIKCLVMGKLVHARAVRKKRLWLF